MKRIITRYRTPAVAGPSHENLLSAARTSLPGSVHGVRTETCYYIETSEELPSEGLQVLDWLLSETFDRDHFSEQSSLGPHAGAGGNGILVEIGPRLNFQTAWSTNAVSVCHACGLFSITRIERSRRFLFEVSPEVRREDIEAFAQGLHDRMTECLYSHQLESFETGVPPEPVFAIPLLGEGASALERINSKMGLGLDNWDIDYYYRLFTREIGRNPTNVECFDLSQSNSEHSRHWFFKGILEIDGADAPEPLMAIIKKPLERNPGNSLIAFSDNSSAIRGYDIDTLIPENPRSASIFRKSRLRYHIIFTAETHNFPSGVAPFPGAETGTGGRIRDVQATGRGALVVAGTAAYCVGNLLIPGYRLPWEDESFVYPPNLAAPLTIEIEASNGASDYGNKFGEPVIQGFTRSFGLRIPGGERREWIKPIMFTGGVGQIDARHVEKKAPAVGMLVTKVGGPAYRIGIGGGAASSMIQGENVAELDFNAVQRGDAEMEQKMNRVIRACVELGDENPIISIHDQGAGGNCNVIKELIYPAGARLEVRRIPVGDATLSVLEIWGAEYQEQNALLIHPGRAGEFIGLCRREKVPCAFIGEITGDGYAVLHDETDGSTPVNLPLDKILGSMPQKRFSLQRAVRPLLPLALPAGLKVREALDRVLRLLSVGSKRFLAHKVDRSVTGLIARQQCAGPLQLTVSDVAVIAQSHFGDSGAAISIGEQPIKGLIDPASMARMSVGEALTNIVWARITALEDIKCSGNWMWAPKLPGEGADLYDAAVAMGDVMLALGIAVDGGKDSLSMAAKVIDREGHEETVKSPGTLVVSAYASCPDITKVVTPDIKKPGRSKLIFIDPSRGMNRMGGSALAHCYQQIGDISPDVDDPGLLKATFKLIQEWIDHAVILAGHDRSDGGLITTIVEMAFAGNCGVDLVLSSNNEALPLLFSEELGVVVEYLPEHEQHILEGLAALSIPFQLLGKTTKAKKIKIVHNGETVLLEDMRQLRNTWEETSFRLERFQRAADCAKEEQERVFDRKGLAFSLSFMPEATSKKLMGSDKKPAVAIIREEGSNGDREMASAFFQAGFETWDVSMTDLLEEKIDLRAFQGVAFVGGFSYADVLDSAKGWAGVIRYNESLWQQFEAFYEREDTFSLGICNGCQLMALLGWVPWPAIPGSSQPRFIHNRSGRFESRFVAVKILESPAVMLRGMERSVLGVWVAHGEGQAFFPDDAVRERIFREGLAPLRYVNDEGLETEQYPFNPNGSPEGIAALCSPDGRHLAMMPHPERTFLTWQWGWMPEAWKRELKASPWLRMFQNAHRWCTESK
ncbi:MAG: phosphoribosylformylglycinamidine synthase [Thermodesulfovibrionales bacterium]